MEQRTLLKIKSLAEETMKKTLIFILLCVSMVLTSCVGPYTSTTSYLKIMEKGHSDNYKEYWIKAYDPNKDTEENAFKIVVNEEMAWNLMEEIKNILQLIRKREIILGF